MLSATITMDRRSLMWLIFKLLVVSTAVYLVIMEGELDSRPPNIHSGVRVHAENSARVRHAHNNGSALRETTKPTKLCILNTDVVLIYTPACGSDVVQNVLFRYGYHKDLFVSLPVKPGSPSISQDLRSGDIRKEDLLQPPAMVSRGWEINVNILAHQVRYNRDALRKIVKGNAKYITILRNPLDRFETDFVSYKLETQFDVEPRPSQSPLERYLGAAEFWEKRRMKKNSRCTANCMSQALGIPVRTGMNMSPVSGETSVIDYIDKLQSEFTLVLIYEQLNPSLVLLKRYMCWSVKDILYDVGLMEPPATQRGKLEEYQSTQFRRVNGADYLLYYHFYDIFSARVAAEGADFKREVRQFKHVLNKVSQYCSSATHDWKVANQTVVWGSEWDDEFVVTRGMCWELRRKRDTWDELFRKRYSSWSQRNN